MAQDHLRPARLDVRFPLQGFRDPGPIDLGVTFEAGDETFQQLGALLCTQAENLRLEFMIWRRHETSGALLWLQDAIAWYRASDGVGTQASACPPVPKRRWTLSAPRRDIEPVS